MIYNINATPCVDLVSLLPVVRGSYIEKVSLANLSWFQTGGVAEVLFRPVDTEDLIYFLQHCPSGIPTTIIGIGSNILVRDKGVPGVVIQLGRNFSTIMVEKQQARLRCGASALDTNVADVAFKAEIGGLEFLSGIPGTIGGALHMNAGAYGREIGDILLGGEVLDKSGHLHYFFSSVLDFTYRSILLDKSWIFTSAILQGYHDNPNAIASRMSNIRKQRALSQRLHIRTCGSTFKNPNGVFAWELIDYSGCRGLCLGGAMISNQHCNFLVNTGNATSSDLEMLGEQVRQRVYQITGFRLEWEISRVGQLPEEKWEMFHA